MGMSIQSVQAAVIGGGIIGTSITYYLAKAGMDVALFDQGDLASGTSGACAAAIAMQTKGSGLKLKLAMESKALYENLNEELGEDVEYDQEGGMIIAETDDEVDYLSSLAGKQKETGLTIELLGRDEVRKRQPALSDSVIAATFCPLDGRVNPLKVTFSYARAAKRHRARIFTFTRVDGIKRSDEKVFEITTDTGTIRTEWVINAGGVWAPDIGKMLGIPIPIKPRRGMLVVTEVVPPLITGSLLSAKYLTSKYRSKRADVSGREDHQEADEFSGGFTLRHSRSGNFIFGSSREFVGYNRNTTHKGISLIVQEAVRLLPALRNVCAIRTFAGLRPFTSDGLPILGKVPGVEGFIMAAGHEGDGIALAPITGRLIANLITKGECPDALSQLNFERWVP
jgi:glycine/D-amino acid oxidase-like deaminating enzyme